MGMRVVTYHIDLVSSNGCYYDAPGPVLFYYRPMAKGSTIFPIEEKGVWAEVHPKYRNSKKIAKEEGFCMGGDYGVLRMPRYTVQIKIQVFKKNILDGAVRAQIEDFVRNVASIRIKKLDRSGTLLISYGDVKLTHKGEHDYEVQFSLGMLFNALHIRSVPLPYVQNSFVWKS